MATERQSLPGTNEFEFVDKLASFDNIEWVSRDFDFDRFSSSARRCRTLNVPRQEITNALESHEFVLR